MATTATAADATPASPGLDRATTIEGTWHGQVTLEVNGTTTDATFDGHSGTLETDGPARFTGTVNEQVGNEYQLAEPVKLTGSSGGSITSFTLKFSK
jgi:hypothetical protein